MDKEPESPDPIQIPLAWIGLDDTPVLMANQYLCQFLDKDQFVLSIGQAVPPPIMGDPDDVRDQVMQLTHVAVKAPCTAKLDKGHFGEVVRDHPAKP